MVPLTEYATRDVDVDRKYKVAFFLRSSFCPTKTQVEVEEWIQVFPFSFVLHDADWSSLYHKGEENNRKNKMDYLGTTNIVWSQTTSEA